MKKILLVNPPQTSSMYCTPPLGILYLASVLERADFQTDVLDCPAEKGKNSIEAVIQKVKEFQPDWVGLTCMTSTYTSAINVAKAIRKESNCKIMIGGAHVTAVGGKTVLDEADMVDVAVEGEAESVIVEIVKEYITGRKCIKQKQVVMDLDSIPFPAWHKVNLDNYKTVEGTEKFATMVSSRGCRYNCIFCDSNKNFRARSPENVVSEIEYLVKNFGIKKIIFYDDNIAIDKNRVIKICDLITEKNLCIKFKCETRVNLVDEALLTKLKTAGCYLISYGIECGHQKGLNFLRKGTTLDMIRNAIKLTHSCKINVLGYFIIGLPIETQEDIMATIKFAIELDVEYAQFSLLTALPGTDLYEYARKNNLLEPVQTTSYFGSSAVPSLKSMYLSKEELMELKRKASLMFYFRLHYIAKRLKMIKSLKDLVSTIGAAKELIL